MFYVHALGKYLTLVIDIIPPCIGIGNGAILWGHASCACYGAIFRKTSVYRSARNNCGYKTLLLALFLVIFLKMRFLLMRFLN